MITALDTDVLLDVLIPVARHGAASKALLDEADQKGALIISEAVYAELATQFDDRVEIENFLHETGIRLEPSGPNALFLAGELWRQHSLKRDKSWQCAQCGQKLQLACPGCGAALNKRQRVLSDFLIGAHASTQADALATRDRGYYRTYFKTVKILSPPAG
jgi:hypothetical protein